MGEYCLGRASTRTSVIASVGRSSSLLVGMTAVTKESKNDHGIGSATLQGAVLCDGPLHGHNVIVAGAHGADAVGEAGAA